MLKRSLIFFMLVFGITARANIVGTDFQNFNPTTNGIDFVTVQAAHTLPPFIINTGVFLNYAANSLTYVNGQKPDDRILGSDVSVGMGLTKHWDFGINIPAVLSQTIDTPAGGETFSQTGVTEIKINTKYQFLGDDNWGLAGILSMNQNLISNDPFSGSGAGPTFNFEVAADKALSHVWQVALNAGYRKRDPGTPIPNVPFTPLKDQWIYSGAASYLLEKYDTKIIFEIYGSQVAQPTDQGTDRSMNQLEALLGAKYDYSHNLALHGGVTTAVDESLGGPDWRVYVGANYTFGPVFKSKAVVEPVVREDGTLVYQLNVSVLFANDSDAMDETAVGGLDDFFLEVMKKGFSKIEVAGHTDSVGSRDYNIGLSERRSANVRKYLMTKFKIDAKKITNVGYGPDYPVANNGNYQGRHQNRRVEFKVWK